MNSDKSLADTSPTVVIKGRTYHYGKDPNGSDYLVENVRWAKDYWVFEDELDLALFLFNSDDAVDREIKRYARPDWRVATPEQREDYRQEDTEALFGLIGLDFKKDVGRSLAIDHSESRGDEPPLKRVKRQLRELKVSLVKPEVRSMLAVEAPIDEYNFIEVAWDSAHSEAGKLRMLEAELDWTSVSDQDKEKVLLREVDFSKITREQLESVYEDIVLEGIEGRDGSVARRLFDRAAERLAQKISAPSDAYRIWQAGDQSAAAAGWGAFPVDYAVAIDVSAASLEEAYALTNKGAWWEAHEVEVIGEYPRSTAVGDIIVDPAGIAHRVAADGFVINDVSNEKPASDEPALDRLERRLADWKREHSPAFRPDPASGRIGPGTFRPVEDQWALLTDAEKLLQLELNFDWTDVSWSDKEIALAREVDFSNMSVAEFRGVYRVISAHELEEVEGLVARRLFDTAHTKSDWARRDEKQLDEVRDTTRNLVDSILADTWPRAGAIVDFGIASQEHYEALYYPVRVGEITPEQLDAALGNGVALTRLVQSADNNPHERIEFTTDWDALIPEPEGEQFAAVASSPSPSEIAETKSGVESPAIDTARDRGNGR